MGYKPLGEFTAIEFLSQGGHVNVVVVGANRGIGLELAKQYVERGEKVFALSRKPAPDLEKLGVEAIEGIDVASPGLESQLSKLDLNIDILIHNAGILRGDRFPDIDISSLREQFEVNTLGPIRTVLALVDKMNANSKVGLVSSRVGSIEDNSSSNNYGYRISKSALNAAGKCFSIDLKEKGISVALLHPGYVKTDMTGGSGLIEADESAKGLIQVMDQLDLKNSGGFWHTNGERLPW